jgi:hypothetical protein
MAPSIGPTVSSTLLYPKRPPNHKSSPPAA